MAEETVMTPVDAAEPPKADPLAKPAANKVSTIKLTPVARPTVAGAAKPMLKPGLKLPPKPGLTQTALKPGLKLPPKPGLTQTALKPGLKLPPKPGLTQTALKPGLKLPPKPGLTQTALKPGVKLPTKPVIRKPGATAPSSALPKPIAPVKPLPIDQQGVGKLPTVEMKPVDRETEATVAPPTPANTLEALKSVTQKLKGITQQIPQQAVLHKTGIVADAALSESQKEASKHKTARISLADAMGVAPVKDEAGPMKTIRIKRPTDIPGATKSNLPPSVPAGAAKPTGETLTPASAAETTEPETAATKPASPVTVTQRKTLKIARPGGGAVRPTGKFGIKRPTVSAAKPTTPAAGDEPNTLPTVAPTLDGAVADIADIPATLPPQPAVAPTASDGPAWLWSVLVLVQAAACVAIGALAWQLLQAVQTNYF